MDDIHASIDRIPLFNAADKANLEIERLGGLTNLVFRIAHDGKTYLLRIPGKGTEDYIDRRTEAHDATIAAESGVSPTILFFDESDGLMLSEFIHGTTMSPAGFADLGCIARAAQAFRKIHDFPKPYKKKFDIFAEIDNYVEIARKLNAKMPDGYDAVMKQADAIRAILEAKPAPLVPCHCDPLSENFIDTGERMYIVDWEYAGNNDPMWDIGDLSVEGSFDEEQDRVLLKSYFDGNPPADQVGRAVIYKSLSDLLWTAWGIVQHANGNPVEDFWAYSVGRFERCKALMEKPEFKDHLAAI